MITFLIDNQKVNCPVSWEEVSIASAIKLRTANTLSEIFKALTGFEFPIEDFQVRNQIYPFITFVSDNIDFDKLPVPEKIGDYVPLKNLGHGTFGQKIQAQRIISNAFKGSPKKVDITSFMIPLLSVYMPDQKNTEQLPFIEYYPVFNHYCNEIIRLVGRDKKYLDSKPDTELTLAGIDRISQFGEMRILDQLSGGDLTKYDEILKMEYDVIFKKLWYMKEMNDITERVHRLRLRKQKQAT